MNVVLSVDCLAISGCISFILRHCMHGIRIAMCTYSCHVIFCMSSITKICEAINKHYIFYCAHISTCISVRGCQVFTSTQQWQHFEFASS